MVSDVVDLNYRPGADNAKLVHRSNLSGRLADFCDEFQFANWRKMLVAWEHIRLKSVRDHCELVLSCVYLTLEQCFVFLCHYFWLFNRDPKLVVQEVMFDRRLEVCHII